MTKKSNSTDAQQASVGTLRGLDWLNFFLADVQTGVGPFLAIYLAGYGWNEERVGIALTVGGIAGILAQTPAGALVDQVHWKRTLIAAGIGVLALGALLIAFVPTFWSVMSAQVLIGGTSSVFGPAICAISLGIVGRHLFDTRQGRNQSFNSAGNVVAAVSMGLLGYFVSNRSIFLRFARSQPYSRCPKSAPMRSTTSEHVAQSKLLATASLLGQSHF